MKKLFEFVTLLYCIIRVLIASPFVAIGFIYGVVRDAFMAGIEIFDNYSEWENKLVDKNIRDSPELPPSPPK